LAISLLRDMANIIRSQILLFFLFINSFLRGINVKIISVIFKKLGVFIVLIIVGAILSILSPDFFTFSNLINIIRQAAIIGVVSSGLCLVMISGGIDLSVGSVAGLASAILGFLIVRTGINIWISIILVIVLGLIVGFVNGIIITKSKIAPFIVTLAGLTAFRGVSYLITRGRPISDISPILKIIGRDYFLKIPIIVWITFIIVIIIHLILTYSLFGTRIRQIGSNREAAVFNGISVNKYLIITYGI